MNVEKCLDITAFSLSPLIGNICTGSISEVFGCSSAELILNSVVKTTEFGGKKANRARPAAVFAAARRVVALRGGYFHRCVPPLCYTRRRGIEFRWKNNVK